MDAAFEAAMEMSRKNLRWSLSNSRGPTGGSGNELYFVRSFLNPSTTSPNLGSLCLMASSSTQSAPAEAMARRSSNDAPVNDHKFFHLKRSMGTKLRLNCS